MRFSLQREVLLKPLAQVVNVVERRQTLPVLANLLARVRDGQLSLTGTDLEVEMVARTAVEDAQDGEITIPARKLFEIVRALPDGSRVTVSQSGDKVSVQAGRSRFSLASLPANDFPSVDEVEATESVSVPEAALKELIERTAFAMAQQDVRYYLNGLLFDLRDGALRCVATDGHRLALCEAALEGGHGSKRQIIVPRKGVQELQRLLEGGDRTLELELGRSHIRVKRDDVTFTSKLIDGKFPDYQPMIPSRHNTRTVLNTAEFAKACRTADIFARESSNTARVAVEPGDGLSAAYATVAANSKETGDNVAQVDASVEGMPIEIAFNVKFMSDVLSVMETPQVALETTTPNEPGVLKPVGDNDFVHIIMPMKVTRC